MERALKMHVQNPAYKDAGCPALLDAEWDTLREFEAVLNITKLSTTLAQTEKKFVGAYGPVVRMTVMRLLRSETSMAACAACAACRQ